MNENNPYALSFGGWGQSPYLPAMPTGMQPTQDYGFTGMGAGFPAMGPDGMNSTLGDSLIAGPTNQFGIPGLGNSFAAAPGGAGGGGSSFFSTPDKQGWGGMALGAAGGLASTLLGMKQYGLAKKTFAENKRQFGLNYDAQKTTTNASLEDRQRARVASNDSAYQSVGDYMNKNGIK